MFTPEDKVGEHMYIYGYSLWGTYVYLWRKTSILPRPQTPAVRESNHFRVTERPAFTRSGGLPTRTGCNNYIYATSESQGLRMCQFSIGPPQALSLAF